MDQLVSVCILLPFFITSKECASTGYAHRGSLRSQINPEVEDLFDGTEHTQSFAEDYEDFGAGKHSKSADKDQGPWYRVKGPRGYKAKLKTISKPRDQGLEDMMNGFSTTITSSTLDADDDPELSAVLAEWEKVLKTSMSIDKDLSSTNSVTNINNADSNTENSSESFQTMSEQLRTNEMWEKFPKLTFESSTVTDVQMRSSTKKLNDIDSSIKEEYIKLVHEILEIKQNTTSKGNSQNRASFIGNSYESLEPTSNDPSSRFPEETSSSIVRNMKSTTYDEFDLLGVD